MREIKFRAWVPLHKKMLVDVVEITPVKNRSWIKFKDREIGAAFVVERDFFMQYTGLNDENGVEIYESDILYFSYGIPGRRVICQVVFDGGAWTVLTPTEGTKSCPLYELQSHIDHYEVIGNIHENPELLEKSE